LRCIRPYFKHPIESSLLNNEVQHSGQLQPNYERPTINKHTSGNNNNNNNKQHNNNKQQQQQQQTTTTTTNTSIHQQQQQRQQQTTTTHTLFYIHIPDEDMITRNIHQMLEIYGIQ
jgi:hypothetical protein